MTENLITVAALVALVFGLLALIRFARHDVLAGPGTRYEARDELGPLSFRRRPA